MISVSESSTLIFRYSALLGCLLILSCGGYRGPAPVKNLSIEPVKQQSVKKGSYLVRKSDTLYSIAFKFGIDFKKLASINQIKYPYTIFPGQVLSLRQTAVSKKKKPVISSTSSSKKTTPKTVNNRIKTATKSNSKTKVKPKVQKGTSVKTKSAKSVAGSNKGKSNKGTSSKAKNYSNFDSNMKVVAWNWPVRNISTKKVFSGKGEQKGINIQGYPGDAILATAAGRVVYSGDGLVGYGKLIIIKHNQSYLSAYANNDKILVKEKSVVKAGQKIATMGKNNTGQVQLHFEIRRQGKPVNPLNYLKPKRR
ncbi:MAG: peptidoglycan DD-metalloendopeptidase family protein [Gammaproteobacteria bacterium]|nr:peptidoglycan DD-metalloendopeptidase family protein [Gammaproteobacteria bacterium]